ncbi:MAG: RluA family pseudouridine synthase [Candidatus Vecturithrix sp.]|jgi:23S rRNA pseudouridine1911/1915/1917 synthase|nr:RluA family pseudouridine synthase [Candidatus Vecturithrix sp.]
MPQQEYTFQVRGEDLWRDDPHSAEVVHEPGKWRLDRFLFAQIPIALSRSQIRNLILDGNVTVNGEQTKPGYWIKASDRIVCTLPEVHPTELTAEQIPLDIVFEDEHLLVLNKAAGMVVHPAPGHYTGTLVHALLHHCQKLSGIGGVQRPGILHRLDRDTSGVMLVAKTDEAHQHLSQQLQTRELTRIYTAVVHGVMKALSGKIDAPIGRHRTDRKKMAIELDKGRAALSLYRVLEQYAEYSLVEVELKTGRTHQIRVHLKHLHHPVVGDPVYGLPSKNNLNMTRQALHARVITFLHPASQQRMTFETALPEDMQQLIERLRENGKR